MAVDMPVMTRSDRGLTKLALTAAMLVTLASPARALAQRTAPVGFAPARVSAPRSMAASIDIGTSHFAAHRAADDTASPGRSHATGLGALAGLIIGTAYGYGLGQDCDGGGSQAASCRRTALIGGAVVGAALGGIAGQLIEIGEEYDARRANSRARARAAPDSATSTSRPSRP